MSNIIGLKILHYNVQKKKDTVIAPLLENKIIKDIDILAIQEPARNGINSTLYNPSSSRFHLAHSGKREARTCFYINKRIDLDTWEVQYREGDLCLVGIQLKGELLWIHNVYNPSPVSTTSRDSPSTLPALVEALDQEGEHLAIGDFNLHHPRWNNPGRFTYHAMADDLLEITEGRGMELGLPQGSVTWRSRGTQSAIDLSFFIENVYRAMASCKVELELDFGSDHLPVQIEMEWAWEELEPRRKRSWKRVEIKETR